MSSTEDLDISEIPEPGIERLVVSSRKEGFFIRHPPKPYLLKAAITDEDDLFQTIHMGAVDVNKEKWLLVIDGLVERPFALNFHQLLKLPRTTVTSFHECFGSPLTPPTSAVWRIGNVVWTGVQLRTLLSICRPDSSAQYIWSDGLDSGVFAGCEADRYQKDLPMDKAMCPEVLVAYEMNGQPLGRERGGPVRLVVPGWFGTNSTKWLCKLSVQRTRAPGLYTTRFYNIQDPENADGRMIPVWHADVNSIIVHPTPDSIVNGPKVVVEGWSWSHDDVIKVEVSQDGGGSWEDAQVEPKAEFSWQRFSLLMELQPGEHSLIARATSSDGRFQALSGRRNHVHSVKIHVR